MSSFYEFVGQMGASSRGRDGLSVTHIDLGGLIGSKFHGLIEVEDDAYTYEDKGFDFEYYEAKAWVKAQGSVMLGKEVKMVEKVVEDLDAKIKALKRGNGRHHEPLGAEFVELD